ncbi:uncharacterized protein [Parasteatoda tepidariorum]|uniref:uncharacterized protein isoform X1 n=2 Tax=Parasteatoda tepidariorum TaxID=114398 RepID=UPI00077FAD14|nr:uncharacterized protein LOC107436691 isoform X2 [Parasteatoda tepidariorum]
MTLRNMLHIPFVFVAIFSSFSMVKGLCFFPNEYLGTYLIQTQTEGFGNTATSFSEITFEPDAIPPWGKCFRRRGNNVILKDSTGGEDCMRCFHITLKAPNVIQIHTEGLGKCYTKEEAVKATCPDDRAVYERKFKEIMLYRKQDLTSNSPHEQVFCPISGKFRFTYTASNGEFRCDQTLSELSNCPDGNVLGVKFRQCSFPNMDVNFRCLGDWAGPNNDRYLALMELKEDSEERFKFRCGIYRVDPLTGRVFVSLSADSTCYNQLRSATDGYESLILTPFPEKSPPGPVLHAHCRFPDWVQGDWEGIQVVRNVLIYKDHYRLQRISLTCLRKEEGTKEDRFIVFSSTHCGEESYNCVWVKKRSENVMEFQIGSQPSHLYSDTLCHDLQFSEDSWVTQGRLKPTQMFPCPIMGDYTGILPENPGFCAKVASDCNNPDVMFYTVSSCENKSLIFEEREYRCLGSWRDTNGVTFTYTQRREMEGFQCFSGKVLQSGKEAYIKEAGLSCIRGEDPLIYGMKITKHASCPDVGLSVSHGPRYPTSPPEDLDETFYSPVPNDPYWYPNERDAVDGKTRKSPTRSTKEEEQHINAAVLPTYHASWIFVYTFSTYCFFWIHQYVYFP